MLPDNGIQIRTKNVKRHFVLTDCWETRWFSLIISSAPVVSRYAACHSEWHVRGLHRGHVQPNIRNFWRLYKRRHKQISFIGERFHAVKILISARCLFLALRHFNNLYSETSSGEIMNLPNKNKKAAESLIEWVQFITLLHGLDSWKQKLSHDFSARFCSNILGWLETWRKTSVA